MDLQRIEEFKVSVAQKKAISQLLAECFPGYPKDRTYYKQLPNFRFLAYEEGKLIGHLAVDHRMIAIDQQPFSIFGVVDICIAPKFRGKQLATTLLDQLEKLGQAHQIDFVLLTASDHQIYLKNGYQLHSNTCRWLFMSDHQTLGVKNQHLTDTILVKTLGKKVWSGEMVDFLGPIF